MALASEQLRFVQHQLDYHFRDPSRLVPCFKAAHRSDIDSTAEDGNRTLAKFGVKIMEMVEKHCSSVLGTDPRGIAHKRSDWIKSKYLRAATCDNLGFTPLIVTSVRQRDETPSVKVRAFAIGAIVAAVFEDLYDQKKSMVSALEKMTDLLGMLATHSLKILSNGSSELAHPQSTTTGASMQHTMETALPSVLGIGPAAESNSLERAGSQEIGSRPVQDFEQHSPIFDFSEWVDLDEAEDTAQLFPLGGDAPPGGMTSPSHGEALDAYQYRVMPQTSNLRSLAPRNNQQLATPPAQSTGSQQTAQRTSAPVIPPIYHLLTLDEEISRQIDKPYAPQLRRLFNHLGSTQSVITFKRALCDLRGRECGNNLALGGARSDADHLRIVKRLRSNSAANSLLMIFHTVRLFQDDADDLVCRRGSFVIRTQTSFGRSGRTSIGNPLSLTKAAVTDRKMEVLYPDLVPGSEEYRAERRYVTKLRQSAAKFALFSDTFGFGILAFLPYADPFGDGYHLNMLMDIPDNSLAHCIKILQQSQPRHLVHLAAGAGPIIEEVISGQFWSSSPSRFEKLEEREVFAASADTSSAAYDYLF